MPNMRSNTCYQGHYYFKNSPVHLKTLEVPAISRKVKRRPDPLSNNIVVMSRPQFKFTVCCLYLLVLCGFLGNWDCNVDKPEQQSVVNHINSTVMKLCHLGVPAVHQVFPTNPRRAYFFGSTSVVFRPLSQPTISNYPTKTYPENLIFNKFNVRKLIL